MRQVDAIGYNQTKPTCGPLFAECLRTALDVTTDPVKLFSAGHITGQAEKIHLGGCSAAMFRPSDQYHEWVISFARSAVRTYNLYLFLPEREEIKDEIWIHNRESTFLLRYTLEQEDVNSCVWHSVRGLLCGVPFNLIDYSFHLRKGYGQVCDRVDVDEVPHV